MFISELSHKCEQALADACAEALSKTEIHDGLDNNQEATQHHTSTSREQLRTSLKTEQGRFRVWARNIGALRDPKSLSSLDSRLHDATKVRSAITSILEGLLASLSRARMILSGDLPNRTAAIEMTDEGVSQGIKTELSELILSVGYSITDLFRYSVFLRRQQPRGREAPSGGELPSPDSWLDIRHTKDKFPKLTSQPWLAERIGNAISQRREYIRFRQRHQEPRVKPQTQLGAKAQGKKTASTKATTFDEAEDESGMSLRQVLDDSGRSTQTVATSFVTIYNDDGTVEIRVPDLERLKFKNIWLKYDEFIECPFCRTIQKLRNHWEWRHHVFTDLQPYVCTFEDCSSGIFTARHDWFRHEMDCHRREWHCLKCHNVFGSQPDLGLHFKTDHAGDIAESQIEPLLNICGRPIRYFGYGSCPLCDTWQPALDHGDNSQDFCKHLAQHLQQLALSAIPLAIDGLEIESDKLPALSESDFTGLEESCPFWLYDPAQYSSPGRTACKGRKMEISHVVTHAVDHHGLVRGRDARHPIRAYIASCNLYHPTVKATGACLKCKSISEWEDGDSMDPLHAGPVLCLRCWRSFDKRGFKEHLDGPLCPYYADQPKTRKTFVFYTTFCSQYRPPSHIPPHDDRLPSRTRPRKKHLPASDIPVSDETRPPGAQRNLRRGLAQGPEKPAP